MMDKGGLTLLGEMLYYNPRKYEFKFEPEIKGVIFYDEPWKYHSMYGFIELSPDTKINYDFVSDTKKIIIFDKISLFHLFIEILPAIVDILTNYEDVEIIFNINQSRYFHNQTTFEFLRNFSGFLNAKYNNRITIVGKIKDFIVSINNYAITDSALHLPAPSSVTKTRELLREFLGIAPVPDKKIYLSRRHMEGIRYPIDWITSGIETDNRIADEKELELFFAKQGFDIVIPEEFDSLFDQLRYLAQASVLVSATSSGLGSMIVMNPGSSVLEIFTTMAFMTEHDGNKYLNEVFHNQYGPSCFTLGLNSARIPNVDRKAKTIIKKIKNSKSLQGFLQIDRIVE